MDVTVGICTYNRAASLERALRSIAAMRVPDGVRWEVIVVDNNSKDHTAQVIEGFRGRLPIRGEFEAKQGKTFALNRAVREGRGAYFLWTDDDVVVDREWLAAYLDAFRQWPDGVVFGGKIVPKFEGTVPSWVAEGMYYIKEAYAERDLGDHFRPLRVENCELPFGANLAIRAAEQRQFLYDESFGAGPKKRPLGEEIDVVERILRAGHAGIWVPGASVDHCIPEHRMTIAYMLHYFGAKGELLEYEAKDELGPRWFGVPRWRLRRLVALWLSYRLHRLTSPPVEWVRHMMEYAIEKGGIEYRHNEYREGRARVR